ncbi:uncharacterized protein LOC129785936 [Lutzomyia longipalpis]|uniref:uncharacterized protein LOC129785936 n=1 Tax=Lutzomyia longipalpis TaxID=7200 RepID=UPI00248387A2|nr:uncharacterized protein LOC129785936 [Lutzomyia longipalpis]
MHTGVKNYTSTLPRNLSRSKGNCVERTSNAEYAIGLERDDMIRPTYGAYACNTLPRGPYLQYKFNDQQNDNNTRQRQHIDELRREFLNLPRAKLTIHADESHHKTQTLGRYVKREVGRHSQNLIVKDTDSQHNVVPTPNYQTLPKAFATSSSYQYNNRVEMANVHQIHTLQQKSDPKQNQLQADYEISNFPFPFHHQVSATTATASNVLKCQPEEIYRAKVSASISAGCPGSISSVNQLNYVTLDEVLRVRPNGFTASEGWALLCQTVQALQDLFLADTPSTSRILPLVTPTSLQITSRGRVAFNIIPAGQTIAHELGRMAYGDAVKYLAPEFLTVMGKKFTFSESDIEKMWIYSLGVTLYMTLPCASPTAAPLSQGVEGDKQQPAPYEEQPLFQHQSSLAPLDFVIRSMCNRNLHNRSTLMYLLDVISEYCKVHHQVKPFSHTVMELFQQVIDQKEHSIPIRHMDEIKSQEEHKSDTDSGRSSDHGEIFRDGLDGKVQKLEVKRMPLQQQNVENTVGKSSAAIIGQQKPTKVGEDFNSGTLQVIRRKRKRETLRRNTIDVNQLELQSVRQHMLNASKSATCLLEMATNESFNRKFDEIDFTSCGISLPDLHTEGKTVAQTLKVRRPVGCMRLNAKEEIPGKSTGYSEKGPDFIVKSFVTPKQIDISDAKCQSRRSINVLLLNGHIIQILCNPVTTTTHDVFQAVMESEDCGENFFLGICALIGGDFVFLPLDLKIYKVAPQAWINVSKKENLMENITFSLFIRIKFYLPTLRGISSLESRHTLYLQLRKSILERHILCTDDDLITLGGFALQAEVGDFRENMKYMEYFTLSHYLPEGVYQKNREMAQYLRNSHYRKRGLLPLEAEHSFIRYVQELKEYGLHLYSAIWVVDEHTSINVFVAISLRGICLFHRNLSPNLNNHLEIYAENSKILYQRKLYAKFEWLEIENLCYSKHILCIVVRNSESLKAKDTNRIKYKLRMDGRKSYFAFSLASDHHKFYMTLRNSFASLKMISSELNVPLRGKLNQSNEYDDGQNISEFVPKIEKPTKPQGNRMRNLKKSMLNDNKLIKLRQKFLKRSKSSVEITSAVENLRRTHITREEVQNKENECPSSIPVSTNSSPRSATWGRNKVKMGTRVFSSQFLNKSFDNICDNVVNSARSEGNYSLFEQSFAPINENLMERDYSDGDNSLKSTSLGSILYAIEKRPDSPPATCDAYVIHSSIRSMQNNYSLPNESISDTLMDKFNNISCSTSTNDRIIAKIKIVKDKVSDSKSSSFERVKFSTLNPSRISKKLMRVKNKLLSRSQESVVVDEKKSSGYTLGISIVQGSDNNMYVKDLVPDGPGARSGIRVGDQILAVDGISLLSLPYSDALKLLQTSSSVVELVVSQLLHPPHEPQTQLNAKEDSMASKESLERKPNNNFDYLRDMKTPEMDYASSIKLHEVAKEEKSISNNANGVLSKSAPDLPKIVAIIPKEPKMKMNIQKKFFGHQKFPVTPAKELKRTTIAPVNRPQPLSLPTECAEKQVFI